MYFMLSTVRWQFDLVYFGRHFDLLQSPQRHISHVSSVLTLLHNSRITLKLKVYRFFTETIDYLGNVVRSQRLEIASYTANAISRLQPPTQAHKTPIFTKIA